MLALAFRSWPEATNSLCRGFEARVKYSRVLTNDDGRRLQLLANDEVEYEYRLHMSTSRSTSRTSKHAGFGVPIVAGGHQQPLPGL